MFKKIIYILVFTFFTAAINADVVKKIEIDGNKKVSDETIKIYGKIELNTNLNENDLNKILQNLYETNFFENVSVNLEENTLKIVLKEYPTINQLIILGEPSNKLKDQIIKVISSKEKNSFIKSNINNDVNLIKRLYASVGYNFSKVETKIKEIDDENFDLIFQIDRGDKTKISSIKFIGNNHVRSNRLKQVIASEEDKFWKVLSKNTVFNKEAIDLNERLLINYYKSLGYYDIRINSNIAEINLEKNVDLIFSIDEGERYFINKLSTNVDEVLDKNYFSFT